MTNSPLVFALLLLGTNSLFSEDYGQFQSSVQDLTSDIVVGDFFETNGPLTADCGTRCQPAIVPSMFGDGGLLAPRSNILVGGVGGVSVAMQNHIYKVAENNAAIPQDRLGFNFNAMSNVYQGSIDGVVDQDDIFEYRLFAEKTFLDGLLSIDFMVPMYYTSDYNVSNLDLVVNGPQTDGAFGDLAFGFKLLVFDRPNFKWSAGLRVEAPTNDKTVSQTPQIFFTSYDDKVWNFTPYLASVWMPSDRLFVQSFLSYRFNTGDLERPGLASIREQQYLMADLSLGYWLIRRPQSRNLTGLVPTMELHYTGSTNEETPVTTVTNRVFGRTDTLNLTVGTTAYLGDRISLGTGVAVPLRDNPNTQPGFTTGTDRRYDWALFVNLNYYFGRR